VSLGRLKDKRAVTPLLTVLRGKTKKAQSNTSVAWYELSHEEVQAAAIIALGNICDNSVIKPILKFLLSENRELVYASTHALGELRAEVALCDYNGETTPSNNLEYMAEEKKACLRIQMVR
jgi:HEAT repeat protein